MNRTFLPRRFGHLFAVALVLSFATTCTSGRRGAIPPGTPRPDQFLFDRGNEELEKRNWLTAREFFRQLSEAYTQSPFRPDAKLAIGDTYLGEGSPESYVLAINEFQEFLAFYPTHARTDYAQFKLGMAHFRQMRAPQRDQTETRSAIREFEAFVERYPDSTLIPEVKTRLREARDNLGTWEFEVGRHYLRVNWYPGAIDRLSTLLKEDPAYSRRDAVYFYLSEALVKAKRQAEALPYLERLVEEFEKSEYLEEARKRIATLKLEARARPSS